MDTIREMNKILPKPLRFSRNEVLDKKKIDNRLYLFAQNYPEKYADNIHRISEIGEIAGYLSGHNVGVNDLFVSDRKGINAVTSRYKNNFNKEKDRSKRQNIQLKYFDKVKSIALKDKKNTMRTQVMSGGKGKPDQLARAIGGIGYAVGMDQKPSDVFIGTNYSSGLKPHEMFVSASQGRFSAVTSANATSDPGAMGKILIANTENIKISEDDCGTKNGISTPITDSNIIGRYQAGTNKLIDRQYLKKLKKRGISNIIVRSPITCESKSGVCRKCFGKKQGGATEIGDNIGIEAAQTLSEHATQMVLSVKHSVGSKKSGPSGFEYTKMILSPKDGDVNFGTVASINGKIGKIEKLNNGNSIVEIGGTNHVIKAGQELGVKLGSHVNRGDIITKNKIVNPKDYLSNNGVLQTRKYVADQLHKHSGGFMDKRVFETIARGYIDLVKNKKDNKYPDLYSYDSSWKENTPDDKKLLSVKEKQIEHKYLAAPVLHYSPGTKINNEMVNNFKKNKITKVNVSHTPGNLIPVFKSYETKPSEASGLWQNMNYRGIKKHMQKEILEKDKTNFNDMSDRAKYSLERL